MAKKQPNIMLIDDEELTQELIRHMLRELDLGIVDSYSSCDKALRQIKKMPEHFDLIISDWDVPGMSGLDFLKEVRKINKDVPFVMVTGNTSKDFVIKAVQAGVTDYIGKPFTANSLLTKVQKLSGAQKVAP